MDHNDVVTGVPIYIYIFLIFWKIFNRMTIFDEFCTKSSNLLVLNVLLFLILHILGSFLFINYTTAFLLHKDIKKR